MKKEILANFIVALFLLIISGQEGFAMTLSITEQLAFSTTRIDVMYYDGSSGTGTAFFFRLKESEQQHIPVIVTNKHVVEKGKIGVFRLTMQDEKGDPMVGKIQTIQIDNFEKQWFYHPDPSIDLAVMPIAPLLNEADKRGIKFFFRSFGKDLLPKPSDLSEFNYVEDILMIGYPIGIQDTVNNMPVFRRGITATHLSNDYEGKKEFIIDAACFPGSSGSPVLLYNVPYYTDKKGNTNFTNRIRLVGILYAGPQYTAEGTIIIKDIPVKAVPAALVNLPINLGYVIKAERILDFESLMK
jgi:hypothetical protein